MADITFLTFSLGLRQMHALSIQANYELRIDLEDFENSTAFAQYDMFGVGLFSVDPEDDGYPLTIGDYTGTAGMFKWLCVNDDPKSPLQKNDAGKNKHFT